MFRAVKPRTGNRCTASGDLYIRISGINRVLFSYCFRQFLRFRSDIHCFDSWRLVRDFLGSQGRPSPLRTSHGRPGVQGIFPTSRGQVPHGWPMVHHSMATGFPIPWGCCLALSASLPFPCPIPLCLIPAPARSQRPMDSLPRRAVVWLLPHAVPRPVPLSLHPVFIPHRVACYPVALAHWGLFLPGTASVAPFPPPSLSPVPRPWPNPLGCCAAPSHPSSRVYTPPGRQQPCGAGPLDPHPSGDRFVRLARVAPFPPPSPVLRPRPILLGCCAARSHPSSRVYTPPGRQQPCGAGPLDPHPSGDRFVRLAQVAPLPPRFTLLCCLPCCPSPLGPSRGPSHSSFSVLSPCGTARCCPRFFPFFFCHDFFRVVSFLPACTHNNTAPPTVSVLFGALVRSPRHPVALPLAVPGHAGRPSLLARVGVHVPSLSPLYPPLPSVSYPPS